MELRVDDLPVCAFVGWTDMQLPIAGLSDSGTVSLLGCQCTTGVLDVSTFVDDTTAPSLASFLVIMNGTGALRCRSRKQLMYRRSMFRKSVSSRTFLLARLR